MHASSKKPLQSKADKFLQTIFTFLVINGKQSTFFQLFQFLCSEIQYIAVILWMQTSFLSYDTQNPISIFIHNFSEILALRDFLQGERLVHFLSACSIALWIYSGFLILLLAYILLKAWRNQDINVRVQTYINSLMQFHSGSIFWIANMVFMTVISSNWHGTNFPVISVHQSEDKILTGTQILFVLFNYGVGFIGAIFCFDPFCTTNLFAARIPTFQFLTFFFKALMAPICAFSPYDDAYSRILFIIAALIISAMRMLHIMREFPFYRYFPTKLAIIFATIGLWLSGTNVLALIWLKQNLTASLSLFYIIILTLPVTVKTALERFSRIIEYYITVEPNNLRTKAQVCAKLFAYKFLSDNIHLGLNDSKALDRYEAYFIGDLALHAKSCNDLECLCKSFLENEDQTVSNKIKSTRSSVSKYFENVSAAFLAEAIQKGKDRNEMKVTLADFMFTNTVQRFSAALIYLFGTGGTHVSFYKRIKRSILTKKIQARIIEYYNDSKDGKLNIVKFLDFQTDSADFLSRITSITAEYLDFWDTVKKANFKFTDILKKSDSIEHAADKIDKLWNSHVEKYDSFYHQMREPYSIYLSLVRNTPSASANVVNRLKWKKKPKASENDSTQITEGDLASSKVLSFHISMVKERIGRVNQVSENVQNSLGYLPQDIIGKNINYLMPSTFAEKHDQLLLRHLEKSRTGEYTENYHTVNSFVKTKTGYVIPCSIYITLFPYIQHELIYCGLLKGLTTKFDFMILDERGYIDGCTEGVNKKLNLNVEKKLHIKEICLDIDRLLTGFSNKKGISSLATEGALDFNNVKRKFTLDHTDDIKEEGVPGAPMVLTFVKWNMSHQY